jgi:S-DNA-T family DNA segregation ATPase FtsK/SpoIIIE
VGAWLAYKLFYNLGTGAYPMALFLTVAAVVHFTRGVADLPLRMMGILLLTSVTAALVALFDEDPRHGMVEGHGGILGIAIATVLREYFSKLMAALILFFSMVVGIILAADDLVVGLRTVVLWVREALVNGWATLRGAGMVRPVLTPVMIGAGNHGGVLEPPPRRRRKIESVEEDEPDEEPAAESAPAAVAEAADAEPGESGEVASAEEPEGGTVELEGETPEERLPPERELIVRMLGKDRAQGKVPPSAWPKELGDYVLPPLTLLGDPETTYVESQEHVVREKAAILERTLQEFRIDGRVVEIDTGPVITLFEIDLAPGIKSSQIASLSNDIARALKAPAVRVVATLPGKNTIGIEVPNTSKEKVRLKELMMLGGVKPTKMALPMFLGKDASGNALITDAATMPHMLIAGTTGSGKSVCLNTLVMSILMTQRPDHVKMILIDPKMVELSIFKDIPHLMCPIVTDMQRAEMILQWATTKMDERYELLAEAGVKDITSFNRLGKEKIYERFQPSNEEEKMKIPTHLPYIVIVIDELADLMMTSGKEVEQHLARLAQKSRAVGIHLIVATQRPQANVVTGLIKSNLPCRCAFRVASRMDSRIVLDQNGAEVLMGQGDMLFLPPGSAKLVRAQGTYIEDEELRAVVKDLSEKAQPQFHHELARLKPSGTEDGGERDPLFDQAVDIIVQTKRGSVSLLQRRLEVGYSRASRLVDQMAAAGIVGEYKGSQAREVLLTEKEWQQIKRHRDREVEEGDFAGDKDADDDEKFGTADLEDEEQAVETEE